MTADNAEQAEKFKKEFVVFAGNILNLITELGAGSVLKKLCSDTVKSCSNLHDDCKSIPASTMLFLLREIEFYNKAYSKTPRPSAKRLLNDSAVILFSINKHLKKSDLASTIETLLEVIKLATSLEGQK